MIQRTLLARKGREDGHLVKNLFGADILTGDLPSITAWSWLLPGDQAILMGLSPEERRQRIDPVGLRCTYVWRVENGWTQEVSDHDVEIIRHSAVRLHFRNPDWADGPWHPVRAWEAPVLDRQEFPSFIAFEDFERDQQRTPHWAGV